METVKCKYCSVETTNTGTEMCDRCYELDHRIENNLELAKKIVEIHSKENVVFQKGDFTTITGIPKSKWTFIPLRNAIVKKVKHKNLTDEQLFYGGDLICESVFDEKNGKLIAAAPDLLEACQNALLHHQGLHSEIGSILRNAIKKATK